MNANREVVEDVRDIRLPGACIVCGGAIDVRFSPGACRGWCATCAWISRPLVWQAEGGLAVAHPPLAQA
jgi:hypothetical protein